MSLKVTFPKTDTKLAGTLIALTFEDTGLSPQAEKLDKTLDGAITSALKRNQSFKGKVGETLELYPTGKNEIDRVILLGLGKYNELDALKTETAGGTLAAKFSKADIDTLDILATHSKKLKSEDLAAHLANGFVLRHYNFDRYKSKKKTEDAPKDLTALRIVDAHPTKAKSAHEALSHVTQGAFLARDLVNTAPNELYPDSYAKLIEKELKPLGVEVEIFDDKKLLKLGMGGISAVGQGSSRKPRMVIMRYNGAPSSSKSKAKNAPKLGFVGKGVTFDTGGISLKPGPNMDEMKMDMGGSAAVVGLIKTLALRGAKCNAVGIVGLAENMPSSIAYRPGDVIKTYAGKTIEVLNTDAEGRLVLADCLSYMQETYSPEFVIDLATLTGAILVALGHEYCGTFVNDDTLWKQMEKASAASGEKLWRMPLDEVWTKEVESEIADLQNTGKGRNAGSCTAAAFLGHFINDGTKWAHMDIAGTAWRKSDQPCVPKFGSGFGVRVLNDLVTKYYEG